MRSLLLIIAWALGTLLPGCAPDNRPPATPIKGWQYSVIKDELRGTFEKRALLFANHPGVLGTSPWLMIRRSGDKVQMWVFLQGGTYTCSDDQPFLISIDGGPVREYPCIDRGSNNLFFGDPGDLIYDLYTAKKLVIEFPNFSPRVQYVYDVEGLNLEL